MRNPLSLEAFADWLAQQPADGEYDYTSIGNCAVCQYLRFLGLPVRAVSSNVWSTTNFEQHPLPTGMNGAALPPSAGLRASPISTFGAAAKRARRALASAE